MHLSINVFEAIFGFLVATFKISPGSPHPWRQGSVCSDSAPHADQMPSQMPQPFSTPEHKSYILESQLISGIKRILTEISDLKSFFLSPESPT